MKKKILFFIIILIINPYFLFGAGTKRIILKECLKIALSNNPNIITFVERKRRALNEYKIFKGRNGLNVSGTMNMVEKERDGSDASEMKVPGIDTDVSLFAGLAFSYTLYNPSKEEQEKIVRLSLDELKLVEQDMKNSIILEVINNYYQCYRAKRNVFFAKRRLEQAEKIQKLAKIFFDKGTKSILDFTRAEVDFFQRQLDFENAKEAERASVARLYLSMGMKQIDDQVEDLIFIGFDKLPELKLEADDLFKLGKLHNIGLKKLNLQKKKAKLRIEISKAVKEPTVGFGFNIGGTNEYLYKDNKLKLGELNDKDGWEPSFTAGIRISIPVYSGGAIEATIDSALSSYNEIEYSEQMALINFEKDIRHKCQRLDSLKKQIETTQLVIENGKRYLLMALKSYEAGLETQSQLKNAEISLVQAELHIINLKRDYLITFQSLVNNVGVGEDYLCKK